MAPRKASRGGTSKSTATPKKRVAANGFKLPDPIPSGQILIDITKNIWVLGKSIGQGGFGEIYLASNNPTRPVRENDRFVVKVEPHSNGPLFTEMHCYMRIAKPDQVDQWMKDHRLWRFGMPKYMGSGSFDYNNQKYRFMVMERFGSDLQKILEQHNKKFSFKTVFQLGLEIIDVLEYIHSKGYIHADIKASNLLIGYQKGTENQVFLVDYGLACRYAVDGVHKEYKYDGRKAHDGTIEFTSRDAHIGAHSRRGDLEILGYNFTQWLCSKLPWEDNLTDCDFVAKHKRWYMDNVDKFMDKCFPDCVPPGLQEYLTYVASLTFDEKPDYEKCRDILREGLIERGYKDDGKLVFMDATPKAASKKPKSRINKVSTTPNRKVRASNAEEEIQESQGSKKKNDSTDMFEDSSEEGEVVELIPAPRKRLTPTSRVKTATRDSIGKGSASSSNSSPRSGGSSNPPRGRAAAINPAIKRKIAAVSCSPARRTNRNAKQPKEEESEVMDVEKSSDVEGESSDGESPASEKENSSNSSPRSGGSSNPPRGRTAAINPAIKRKIAAVSCSPARRTNRNAKQPKEEESEVMDVEKSSDVEGESSDGESPASEKENSSRSANIKPLGKAARPNKVVVTEEEKEEDDVFEIESPPPKPKNIVKTNVRKARVNTKSKGRGGSSGAGVKRSANKDSNVESNKKEQLYPGFDNPTPAMLELIAKKEARLVAAAASKKRK